MANTPTRAHFLLHAFEQREEVRDALNRATDFRSFCYHWDNYELGHVSGFPASPKLYEELKHEHDFEVCHLNHWLDHCRKVVREKQTSKYNGQWVDYWTASVMCQIYDKLSDKNKKKFHEMHFAVAHHVAMEIVKKNNEEKTKTI